jgi:magnesium-transporting ATPase (P-type)
MPQKTYMRILQVGLFASLLIVFFVFKDLLFPYITSKQLAFNILMEFLAAIWLVFILRYPEYRPKNNLITYGLIAYFTAIFISCLVSVNFT